MACLQRREGKTRASSPYMINRSYIGESLSKPDFAESKRISRRRRTKLFDTDSAYRINEIVFGEIIPGPDSDYGVFVFRGESKYGHNRVLILAIMKTDGKSFWFLSTDIVSEAHFTSETILSTRDRNLSAIFQTVDGKLIVSLFDTSMDGTVTETSHVITLPVETSLRAK